MDRLAGNRCGYGAVGVVGAAQGEPPVSYHIYILGYKQPGALEACARAVESTMLPGSSVEVVDLSLIHI